MCLHLKGGMHAIHHILYYTTLHTQQMLHYKTAILLHKIFNNENMPFEWQQLFFNQNFNQRNNRANFRDLSKRKIGKNLITNRLTILNNKIPYDWLNVNIVSFKLKCKELFLNNQIQ